MEIIKEWNCLLILHDLPIKAHHRHRSPFWYRMTRMPIAHIAPHDSRELWSVDRKLRFRPLIGQSTKIKLDVAAGIVRLEKACDVSQNEGENGMRNNGSMYILLLFVQIRETPRADDFFCRLCTQYNYMQQHSTHIQHRMHSDCRRTPEHFTWMLHSMRTQSPLTIPSP